MQQHRDEARQHAGSAGGGGLILAQSLFCAGYIGFALSYASLGLTAAELIYPLSLILVASCAWSLWSWRILTGSLFTPYSIFFLSAALFNGGCALLEVFHLNQNGLLGREFPVEVIVPTLLLVTIGLSCFHLGALIGAAWADGRARVLQRMPSSGWFDYGAIRLVGWSMLAISLPATLLMDWHDIGLAMSSGYGALYQQNAGTGLAAGPALLAEFLIPATIFILIGSQGRRLDVLVSAFVVSANAALELTLGYRAFAVWPVLAYVWAYHRTVRPVPRIVILGGGTFLMAVVFPLVAAIRNTPGASRTSLAYLWHSYRAIDSPVISILSEIGGSMATVAYTIELVPQVRPFEHGLSYFYAATTVLPNVFGGDVHPAIAHGTASSWLVWNVNPYIAARGGGLGYSFIAEAFLNFGWLGSPVALALIGLAFGGFFWWSAPPYDANPLKIALAASFLSVLSHYARGEAIDVVRPLVWYCLVPSGLVLVLSSVAGRPLTQAASRLQRSASGALRKSRGEQAQPRGSFPHSTSQGGRAPVRKA